MPSMILSRRAKIALSVVAALVVLLIVLAQLSGIYINFLWYDSVKHGGVYSTMLWTKVSLFLIFGALMALIIGGNLVVAYLLRPPFRPMSPEQHNLQNYAAIVEPRRKLILIVAAVIAFLAAGASAQGNWAMWQLWLHGGPFPATDPLFHLNISFYAWDYPVYRSLLGFGFAAVIFSLVLVVIVHYLTGAIRLQTPGPKMTIAARRHITALVFVFMALKAVAYWLDRYGLVFSTRSKFTGASYTDVHSALPAKTILFWIAVILALGVLASMWLRSALLPGIGFVVLLVLSILIGGIYPAVVQSVSVNPNASDKERPYIERNILATRQAYDIATRNAKGGGTVSYVNYNATSNPDPAALTNSNATVGNIRILDPNIISPTFTNQQKIALPYGFSPQLSVDRYKINGVTHDYIVGVRELHPGNITGPQNNWINQYTVYTHGYGFVAARADTDITNNPGQYTEYDIPPVGPLKLTQPDVYFGQGMNSYSIVGAQGTKREYDGSNSSQPVTYHGGGGVSLSNFFTRLAFAIKYKETNFLLNDAVRAPGASIIFNRDPKQMVQKVAPFLTVDGSPYPIVDQGTGDIVWMVDGYTTMANYPYSQRQSLSALTGTSLRHDQANTQINYIRNSVKATVDAYTGQVKLYAWDPSDPVLKAWQSVFPGLIQPADKMPPSIRAHVRYPQDLFNVQRALLAQYHITDPVASYNGRGKWAVPQDPFAFGAQPPYYILATPPGGSGDQSEFQLTSPMTVARANNLAAYISANCDPGPNYGKLTVLQVQGSTTIAGPKQVASDFKTNSVVTKDLSLFNGPSGQSRVEHGNLLTMPVGHSFLYVEPLYVQASYPTLQRVIAFYGGKIGYGSTLQAALDDIRFKRSTGSTISLGETTNGQGTPTNSSPPPPPSKSSSAPAPPQNSSSNAPPASGSVQRVLNQLDRAYAEYQAAQQSNNQGRQFAAAARILDLLAQYHRLSGQAPPAQPSTSSAPSSAPSPSG